jgi:hypothetical protein
MRHKNKSNTKNLFDFEEIENSKNPHRYENEWIGMPEKLGKNEIKSTQGFHFKTKEACIISIGEKVTDCTGMIGWNNDQGTFTVERIDINGWVWGSEMKTPYYNGKKLNFLDNNPRTTKILTDFFRTPLMWSNNQNNQPH